MYRIYYTVPNSIAAHAIDIDDLSTALKYAESLRDSSMFYVTMVSDYANMVGKPGAASVDSNYVPQTLN
jgi:hypothetical protein